MYKKKEICFNIIWLAILNREEPEKEKLKATAWDPLKERSNFTFSTLWNKYDFLKTGLISTPEIYSMWRSIGVERAVNFHIPSILT